MVSGYPTTDSFLAEVRSACVVDGTEVGGGNLPRIAILMLFEIQGPQVSLNRRNAALVAAPRFAVLRAFKPSVGSAGRAS